MPGRKTDTGDEANAAFVSDETGAGGAYPDRLRSVLDRVMGFLLLKSCDVSVTIVSDASMRRLNRTYRKKDRPTDVLSFPQENLAPRRRRDLGDIVISLPTAIRQARRFRRRPERELATLAVHGFLHLLGYDHGRRPEADLMLGLQNLLLRKAAGRDA